MGGLRDVIEADDRQAGAELPSASPQLPDRAERHQVVVADEGGGGWASSISRPTSAAAASRDERRRGWAQARAHDGAWTRGRRRRGPATRRCPCCSAEGRCGCGAGRRGAERRPRCPARKSGPTKSLSAPSTVRRIWTQGMRHALICAIRAGAVPTAAQRISPSTPCSLMRRTKRSWRCGFSLEFARKASRPARIEGLVDPGRELGVERVGDFRHDDADGPGQACSQARGAAVVDVADGQDRFFDALARARRDERALPEHQRDRGARNARLGSDIAQRGLALRFGVDHGGCRTPFGCLPVRTIGRHRTRCPTDLDRSKTGLTSMSAFVTLA